MAPIQVLPRFLILLLTAAGPMATSASAADERHAYFGDLHVHTRFSFDAFMFGTRATPDDAYRYARGEAITHPAGYQIQLDRPLDFYAVTDHGFFLGMWSAMTDPQHPLANDPQARRFLDAQTAAERGLVYAASIRFLATHPDPAAVHSAWQEIIASAQRNYEPNKLTTFISYEYTSSREGNLHRNVIFRGDRAPDVPFTRIDSLNPEKLWDWMDNLRDQGIEALAIPHNSNGSNGHMFELQTFDGKALSAAYAAQRMRNEPLVEITQVKGTSDTHPFLSPNDEWADFEIFPYRIASWLKSEPRGSYVRDAYMNGLQLQQELGINPYRFGIIGSSDTHNAGPSLDESNFVSKIGSFDASGPLRGSVAVSSEEGFQSYRETYYRYWGASGLAGVWAEENTRASIFDAFRRKETFATSGPRMRVRFFAGYELSDDLLEDRDLISKAYAKGVPMGGDLLGKRRARPSFLVWALRDPLGTSLQRLQVIKGWIDKGVTKEQVFDVACSDGLKVDPISHRCPDNGATVDLTNCSVSKNVGADELKVVWQDPTFNPRQAAFYYVRALENPTCRWSTWDAIRAGTPPRPDLVRTLQERVWSSPIWYRPR